MNLSGALPRDDGEGIEVCRRLNDEAHLRETGSKLRGQAMNLEAIPASPSGP